MSVWYRLFVLASDPCVRNRVSIIRKILPLGLLFSLTAVAAPAPLLNIDTDRITVSGISAGGQMAHQLHIAYPDLISGAGIIAGGPFGCANGSLATAMARCMGKVDGQFPVAEVTASIHASAVEGFVADPALLADDPVWLFHGSLDTVVAAEVSDALAALYANFTRPDNIRYVNDIAAAHTFPAHGQGNDCTTSQSPFVGNCNYDAAGKLLQHLYAGLKTPHEETLASLTSLKLPGATEAGLIDTAFMYIPKACENAATSCAFHLVFHGCAQSSQQVDTAFIEQSGYLPWAQANDIVLAFPQVASGVTNPYACWDWWGYTGPNYRWRDGAQMKVVVDWIQGFIDSHKH